MKVQLIPRVLIGLALLTCLGTASIGIATASGKDKPPQVNALEYAAKTKSTPANLIDLHAHAGRLTNRECLGCHAKILTSTSLDKKIKTFHRLHLESKLPTPKNCADCHQAVDLRNGSAAALRKQVNPQICAGCHTGAMKGAKILFAH